MWLKGFPRSRLEMVSPVCDIVFMGCFGNHDISTLPVEDTKSLKVPMEKKGPKVGKSSHELLGQERGPLTSVVVANLVSRRTRGTSHSSWTAVLDLKDKTRSTTLETT